MEQFYSIKTGGAEKADLSLVGSCSCSAIEEANDSEVIWLRSMRHLCAASIP
jgi:hypothetical protein